MPTIQDGHDGHAKMDWRARLRLKHLQQSAEGRSVEDQQDAIRSKAPALPKTAVIPSADTKQYNDAGRVS
jgi:hypothetical protein